MSDLSKRELIAGVLSNDRLAFYIGGDIHTECVHMGITLDQWTEKYPLIMAERAKIVADSILKVMDTK